MVLSGPLFRLRNSCFLSLFPLFLLLCLPFASGQTFSQGQPIVGVGTSTPVSSPMFLDASQFAGAPDICAQINAPYRSTSFTGNIDATAFTGLQPCLSNPFHGKKCSGPSIFAPQCAYRDQRAMVHATGHTFDRRLRRGQYSDDRRRNHRGMRYPDFRLTTLFTPPPSSTYTFTCNGMGY